MRNHSRVYDFDLHENETACGTHFHMKGFALRLVLKQRHTRTRKWPVGELKALVNEDTLLPMMFLGLRKLGNICGGHKMFLKALANEDTLLRTHCCGHNISPFARPRNICPGHKKCFWFCSETFCVRNKCFPVCAA